jgi:integrase
LLRLEATLQRLRLEQQQWRYPSSSKREAILSKLGSCLALTDQEAVDRANIKPAIGFHGLRHTWASLAVMNGTPLMIVARNLGYRDTRMCELHYADLARGHVGEAIRAGAPKFGMKPDSAVMPLRSRGG